jgi:5-oxopent-3-ene-1,2,5-tricarboxylate decarboxylase/2-hydroxyhepta-2,4-diene-1,7-dioate isomerase
VTDPREVRLLLDGEGVNGRRSGDRIVLDDGREIAEADAAYLPPVQPSKVLAVHLTYRSRIDEYRAKVPPEPSYFVKPPTTLNGHRGTIRRPRGAQFLNYEGELAVVIGKRMKGVPESEVLDYVAGYLPANDVGLHDFRHADRGSMLRVKGQDGYCPLGPGVVRPDAVDPTRLRLRTYVNGRLVQEGSSSELLFPYAYMIADLARLITLEPGDVLLTGTPANSRPVEPGDVVEVEVDGIGRLSNTVVEQPVDWLGIRTLPEDSPNTRHVALAISEQEAEAGVGKRY